MCSRRSPLCCSTYVVDVCIFTLFVSESRLPEGTVGNVTVHYLRWALIPALMNERPSPLCGPGERKRLSDRPYVLVRWEWRENWTPGIFPTFTVSVTCTLTLRSGAERNVERHFRKSGETMVLISTTTHPDPYLSFRDDGVRRWTVLWEGVDREAQLSIEALEAKVAGPRLAHIQRIQGLPDCRRGLVFTASYIFRVEGGSSLQSSVPLDVIWYISHDYEM